MTIIKNIKIILFSSLMVAMILPFSAMDTAAEIQTDEDELAKLLEYKKEIKSQLKETEVKSERKELRKIIKRVNVLIDLLHIKQDHETNKINLTTANNQTTILLEKLDSTFTSMDTHRLDMVMTNVVIAQSGTYNYATTTQTKFNCDTISNQIGYNYGTVTGIDFVESYVVAIQGYPSSIAIMENNYCTEKNFDYGYVKYRNVATGKMCTGDLPTASSVAQGYCAKFGTGSPVFITATAWYDGSNPFNITEGWEFIWVP